jgi:hypothetical protein
MFKNICSNHNYEYYWHVPKKELIIIDGEDIKTTPDVAS